MADIDRLIELGLNRYGAGDLDGALLMWEEVLAIDPDNAQAISYVDYVRLNYELLSSGEPSVDESLDTKFAIEEEPEYQIEIIPARPSEPELPRVELPKVASPVSLEIPKSLASVDAVDAGWDLEETHDTSAVFPGETQDSDQPVEPPTSRGVEAAETAETQDAPLELQLEADEPPPPVRDPVNFEDATREYHGVVQQTARPALPLPADFSTTEPTHGDFNADEYTGGFNGPQATPAGFGSQETSVRKRDLGFVQPTKPAVTVAPAPIHADDLELGQYDATQERAPRYDTSDSAQDDDLISSLPTPTPQDREPESGEIRIPSKSSTRDLPEPMRAPARRESAALSQAEVMLPHAPTRELTPNEIRASALEPMLSAPTRELGLRPGSLKSPDDDDVPTGQSDARAIRAAADRSGLAADRSGLAAEGSRPGTEGTKHDIVLPFDPIAAQAAQILDDVDAGAPAGEPADERTRRRVTRLLELAGDWTESGDLDKAVSAVDLALSEDPNSALGQKLITRNKDTIMSLFQSYLGDLDRMPSLAKPLHELANAPISPRAAFLLSRIDGTLTIDELLDVSGMPRLEAYRHLCQLYLRGILR